MCSRKCSSRWWHRRPVEPVSTIVSGGSETDEFEVTCIDGQSSGRLDSDSQSIELEFSWTRRTVAGGKGIARGPMLGTDSGVPSTLDAAELVISVRCSLTVAEDVQAGDMSVGMFSTAYSTRLSIVLFPMIIRTGVLTWSFLKKHDRMSTETSESNPISPPREESRSLLDMVM